MQAVLAVDVVIPRNNDHAISLKLQAVNQFAKEVHGCGEFLRAKPTRPSRHTD